MSFVAMLMAATVSTANPAGDVITPRNADMMVMDSANQPLFRSTRDFLLKMANNPTGQVVRYDPLGKRVLVSSSGPEYWVACAELSPMAASCPVSPPKPATRSIKFPRSGGADPSVAARGLPACPGDPRCPKSD